MSSRKRTDTPDEIFRKAETLLQDHGLTVIASDKNRPWGGFLVIDEEQASEFITVFFPELRTEQFSRFEKLSPKLLLVAPGQRLSWQYHHRRSEIWRVIEGRVGVVVSQTDVQPPVRDLDTGETIRLKQGERHRLVGLSEWAVIAEIWQHTDPQNPSDEEDIIRLEDDFGR